MISVSPKQATIKHEPQEAVSRLSVNLLPLEVLLSRRQNLKLTFSTKLSIITLVITIFFASATLTLRLFQSSQLKDVQGNVALAEQKVEGLKSKEEESALIKNRLSSIKNLMDGDIKRKAIFNLVVFLSPPGVEISEAAVDKNGKMTMSVASPSLALIDELISNLGNQEKNVDLISKVDLDGLSIGKDAFYRFALKITPRSADKE